MKKLTLALIALFVSIGTTVVANPPFPVPPGPREASRIARHLPPVNIHFNNDYGYRGGYRGGYCDHKPFYFFGIDIRGRSGCGAPPCVNTPSCRREVVVRRSGEHCTTLHLTYKIEGGYEQRDKDEVFAQARLQPNPDAVAQRIFDELDKATVIATCDGKVYAAWKCVNGRAVRVSGGRMQIGFGDVNHPPSAPEGSAFDGYHELRTGVSVSGNPYAEGTLQGMQDAGYPVYQNVRGEPQPFGGVYRGQLAP